MNYNYRFTIELWLFMETLNFFEKFIIIFIIEHPTTYIWFYLSFILFFFLFALIITTISHAKLKFILALIFFLGISFLSVFLKVMNQYPESMLLNYDYSKHYISIHKDSLDETIQSKRNIMNNCLNDYEKTIKKGSNLSYQEFILKTKCPFQK